MFENRCEFYSCTSILNVSKYYFLFLFDSIFENNFVFVFIPYPSFVVMSHFSLRMLRIFGMIIFPVVIFLSPTRLLQLLFSLIAPSSSFALFLVNDKMHLTASACYIEPLYCTGTCHYIQSIEHTFAVAESAEKFCLILCVFAVI